MKKQISIKICTFFVTCAIFMIAYPASIEHEKNRSIEKVEESSAEEQATTSSLTTGKKQEQKIILSRIKALWAYCKKNAIVGVSAFASMIMLILYKCVGLKKPIIKKLSSYDLTVERNISHTPVSAPKKDSRIGAGKYPRIPMHIEGIPDNICYGVSIVPQEGGTCGKCAFSYLLQRADKVDDSLTKEYREDNQYFDKIKEDPNLADSIKKMGFDGIFAQSEIVAHLIRNYFYDKIIYINTGIAIYADYLNAKKCNKSLDEFFSAVVENYRVFDVTEKNLTGKTKALGMSNKIYLGGVVKCINRMLGTSYNTDGINFEDVINTAIPFYLANIYEKIFDKIRKGESAFIFLAPVLGNWVAHALAFEIEPNSENPKFPFKIICYDSLARGGWRGVGVKFIYDLLVDRSHSEKYDMNPVDVAHSWLISK